MLRCARDGGSYGAFVAGGEEGDAPILAQRGQQADERDCEVAVLLGQTGGVAVDDYDVERFGALCA